MLKVILGISIKMMHVSENKAKEKYFSLPKLKGLAIFFLLDA